MPGYRIALVKQKAVSECGRSVSEELLVACHEQRVSSEMGGTRRKVIDEASKAKRCPSQRSSEATLRGLDLIP